MNWSIQNMMGVVFSAVVLIIVLVSLTTYRNAYHLIDANQLAFHSHEVQGELGAILSILKDAETGQRGFLLTGEERYLEPYQSATASLDQTLSRLQRHVADNPAQLEKIKQLGPLIARKMQELDQTIRLRREKGLSAAQAIVRLGGGKECMDRIRQVIGSMQEIEDGLLAKRIEEVRRENSSTTFAMILATLLNLFLLALGYYAITKHLRERREFTARINQLNQKLQQNAAKPENGGRETAPARS